MKNAKMTEFTEEQGPIYRKGLRSLKVDREKNYLWKEGVVVHDLGIVSFTQYYWRRDNGVEERWLKIEVIHDGYCRARQWDAFFGEKTIARLANEFIEEVKG